MSLAFVAIAIAFTLPVVAVQIADKPVASFSGWDLVRGPRMAYPPTSTSAALDVQYPPQVGAMGVYALVLTGILVSWIPGRWTFGVTAILGFFMFLWAAGVLWDFMENLARQQPLGIKDLQILSYPATPIFGALTGLVGILLLISQARSISHRR